MEIALVIIGIGVFISLLHWCMGSPSGDGVIPGRIFSVLGRFIVSQFLKFEEKEMARMDAKMSYLLNQEDNAFRQASIGKYGTELSAVIAAHELKMNKIKARIDNGRKLNIWKAAGACIVCFAVWLAFPLWCVGCLALGIEPIWVVFGLPVSVWVAIRADF